MRRKGEMCIRDRIDADLGIDLVGACHQAQLVGLVHAHGAPGFYAQLGHRAYLRQLRGRNFAPVIQPRSRHTDAFHDRHDLDRILLRAEDLICCLLYTSRCV